LSRDPTKGLEDDLAAQVEFVYPRAPACGRLLEALAAALDDSLRARLREAWAERRFDAWYERPLLLLASVRDDALLQGPAHPLWAAIQIADPDPDKATEAAVAAALAPERRHLWNSLAGRSLQTNDPTRSIAWILPAAIAATVDPGRPLALFEIGCSGGLNLVADRLPPEWTRSDGAALRLEPRPPVERRSGFDLRPIDVLDEDGARWLRASVWPGQLERGERLEAAIDAFRALAAQGAAPMIERLTAADIPARLPILDRSGPRGLAFQSVVRDYLLAEERRRYEEGMRRWLTECAPGAAVWVEFEVTETAREGGPPVELVAHTSDGDRIGSWPLAHSDPHPTKITVDDDACVALRAALGANPR
jgi:hypothetical protein